MKFHMNNNYGVGSYKYIEKTISVGAIEITK